MPRLALYTFGALKSPLADPAPPTRDFHDRAGGIYQRISRHPGYLAHAEAPEGEQGTHFELDWGAWGEFAVPDWYGKGRTPETIALAATLSLWTGLQPAFDAVYTGPHREALNRRRDWFERATHPTHACWWVADDVTPTWREGVSRLEHLHGHAPAPHAFTFRHPFDPAGTPARISGAAADGSE
ncbi:DUF3291 domain-containing protein [Streptomyces andamanensis]|uniref:DUF3291 domain-containing protein n=1 Tax=Streptomyces andamanensis TaxID=1565035 RepID=A0ABV8TIE7_9ACTN